MAPESLRLLCLDGGGVRGLSSLLILRALMDKLQDLDPAATELPKPCDVFDMIGGTSTGGLIAVMLGRLKMSVDECIHAYTDLADQVFAIEDRESSRYELIVNGCTPHVVLKPRYDSNKFVEIVKRIVKESGLDEDAPLKNPSANECKVFVCAASRQYKPVTFRSYLPARVDGLVPNVKIWEACRTTSAAQGYFDAQSIDDETFTDGGILNNSPTTVLYNEAADAWAEYSAPQQGLGSQLACVVSIGTGVPELKDRETSDVKNLVNATKNLTTNTEREAQRFATTDLGRDPRHFRFNVERGLGGVGLDASQKNGVISSATRSYCQRADVLDKLESCAGMLAGKVG